MTIILPNNGFWIGFEFHIININVFHTIENPTTLQVYVVD